MEDRDEELIERFFRQKLSPEEQAEFERRREADAAFREAAELHGKALQAIRLQEKAEVLGKLSERGRQLDERKKNGASRHWWWLGGGTAFLLAFFFWFRKVDERASATQTSPAVSTEDSTQIAEPPDTSKATRPTAAPPAPPAQQQEKQPPIAGAKEKQERLFAEHFKPYKDESLEPSLRGNEAPSASQQFHQLYWDGKYREALAQFNNLAPRAKITDNLLFVKAECLLATGKADEAVAIYEAVLKNDRTRFMSVASWHLALAYLKTGDLDKAKKQLEAVQREADSPWQTQAAGLLGAL